MSQQIAEDMKKISLLFMGIALVLGASAQVFNYQWSGIIHHRGAYAFPKTIYPTSDGGFYTSGVLYQDTIDIDPSGNEENLEVGDEWKRYIARFDNNNELMWSLMIPGTTSEQNADPLYVDSQDNIFIAGTFQGIVDFDPSESKEFTLEAINEDSYMLELDKAGAFVMAKKINEGDDFFSGSRIIPWNLTGDGEGNIYCFGYFKGSLTLTTNAGEVLHKAESGQDLFVVKINKNGKNQWAHIVDASKQAWPNKIVLDHWKHVILTGSFNERIEPSHNSNGKLDYFIYRLSEDGKYFWSRSFGAEQNDEAKDVIIDPDNNIILLADFEDSIDIDPDTNSIVMLHSLGENDGVLQKITPNGRLLWGKRLGNASSDFFNNLEVDRNGNLYLADGFLGTTKFDDHSDKGTVSAQGADCFILQLDSDGEYKEIWNYGGSGGEAILDFRLGKEGFYLTGGSTSNTVDLNPDKSGTDNHTIVNTKTGDFFITRLEAKGLLSLPEIIVDESEIKLYPNPCHGRLVIAPRNKRYDIKLYSLDGRLIDQYEVNQHTEIDLSQIESGTYLVECISDSNQLEVHRFILY